MVRSIMNCNKFDKIGKIALYTCKKYVSTHAIHKHAHLTKMMIYMKKFLQKE